VIATNCGSTGHRKTLIDVYKSIHLWPVDPQFVARNVVNRHCPGPDRKNPRYWNFTNNVAKQISLKRRQDYEIRHFAQRPSCMYAYSMLSSSYFQEVWVSYRTILTKIIRTGSMISDQDIFWSRSWELIVRFATLILVLLNNSIQDILKGVCKKLFSKSESKVLSVRTANVLWSQGHGHGQGHYSQSSSSPVIRLSKSFFRFSPPHMKFINSENRSSFVSCVWYLSLF
jgi:hypothetical protein